MGRLPNLPLSLNQRWQLQQQEHKQAFACPKYACTACKPVIFCSSLKTTDRQIFAYSLKTGLAFFPSVRIQLFRFAMLRKNNFEVQTQCRVSNFLFRHLPFFSNSLCFSSLASLLFSFAFVVKWSGMWDMGYEKRFH